MVLEKIDISKIMAKYGFHDVNEFQLMVPSIILCK